MPAPTPIVRAARPDLAAPTPRRTSPRIGLLLLAVLAVALPTTVLGAPALAGAAAPVSFHSTPLGVADGALSAASASLAAGAGPAAGRPLACSAGPGTSTCGPAAAGSGSAALRAPVVGAGRWTFQNLSHAPSPRWSMSMTWDAADGYVFAYGGVNYFPNTGGPNESWKFHDGKWTQLFPTGNGPRSGGSSGASNMLYDPIDGYVVYVSSSIGPSPNLYTFSYRAGVWTNLSSATPSPPVVWRETFVWDEADGYGLLFGGCRTTSCTIVSDLTWSFHHGRWTNRTTAASPPARARAMMAYDAPDNAVVLFGGENGAFLPFADTWEYTAGRWTQLHPTVSPSARDGSMVATFPGSGMYLVGGENASLGRYSNQTWYFANGSWTNESSGGTPGALCCTMMAYDGSDNALVEFGGYNGLYSRSYYPGTNETWLFQRTPSTPVWSAAPLVSGAPPGLSGASLAYDATARYVVLFGGINETTTGADVVTNATWTYHAGVWTQRTTAVAPSARYLAALAYDPSLHGLLLFGGDGSAGKTPTYLGDTWEFAGGTWSRLAPAASPPARFGATIAWSSAQHAVVLGGGLGVVAVTSHGNETDEWLYAHGNWTPYAAPEPFGGPYAALAAGPGSGELLYFGPCGAGTNTTFNGTGWGRTGVAHPAPPATCRAPMMLDPRDDRVVLYDPGTGSSASTWGYGATGWSNLSKAAGPAPPARFGASLVYDAADGYLLLYGGSPSANANATYDASYILD